jgi:hypothetical protein
MKKLSEDELDKIEKEVASLTGVERRYFRYLTIKYCSIKGKPLSEYKIVNILGCDETTTMTIVRDLDNKFDEIMKLMENVKDHAHWEVDEAYYIEQEKKEEVEMKDTEQKLDDIESKLKKLSRIELEYFRNWLMNHYPIYAMGHDIGTIMMTIDGVGVEYEEIDDLLNNINDHSKWEIEESYFLEEEKSGYYTLLEAQELMENLSGEECEIFINTLKEKFPIYEKDEIVNTYQANDSFGKDGYPTWEEALAILKEIKPSEE